MAFEHSTLNPRCLQWRQDVSPDASDDPYTRLLALVLLPRLANALTHGWEPRDPEPALRFLEAWAELLPLGVQRHVLDTLILPKVGRTCEVFGHEEESALSH